MEMQILSTLGCRAESNRVEPGQHFCMEKMSGACQQTWYNISGATINRFVFMEAAVLMCLLWLLRFSLGHHLTVRAQP